MIRNFHLLIMIISKKNGFDVYHHVLACDKGRNVFLEYCASLDEEFTIQS